jgi:predicted enzyme related to lactoylglutathione lyase
MRADIKINVSIDVPDLAAGLAFYGSVFGITETARPLPAMAILDGGNLTICMHEKKAGSEPMRVIGRPCTSTFTSPP